MRFNPKSPHRGFLPRLTIEERYLQAQVRLTTQTSLGPGACSADCWLLEARLALLFGQPVDTGKLQW